MYFEVSSHWENCWGEICRSIWTQVAIWNYIIRINLYSKNFIFPFLPGPGLIPHLAGPDADSSCLRPATQWLGGGWETHQQTCCPQGGDWTVGNKWNNKWLFLFVTWACLCYMLRSALKDTDWMGAFSMQVWRGLWATAGHERAAWVRGGSSPSGRPAAVAPKAWCWLEQAAGDVGEQERGPGAGSHFPPVPARCQASGILPQQSGETEKDWQRPCLEMDPGVPFIRSTHW